MRTSGCEVSLGAWREIRLVCYCKKQRTLAMRITMFALTALVLLIAGCAHSRGDLPQVVEPIQAPEAPPPWCPTTNPVLKHLLFERNAVMPTENRNLSILNVAVIELTRWYSDTITIEGHTCDIGTSEYNSTIGLMRAEAVADYLVQKGIARERITVISHGETRPVVPNDSDDNRALNRRVVLIFNFGSDYRTSTKVHGLI